MSPLNSLTLDFADREIEQAFDTHTQGRTRHQGRVALALGVAIYLMYGVLDQWFVPGPYRTEVWEIRLTALTVPLAVYLSMFTPWFDRFGRALLALVGLAAGAGIIGMSLFVPFYSISLYYPGMILATFYTYNLVGTRFIYALAVDLALLLAYNVVFAFWKAYPLPVLASHDFYIVSSNLIGGAAGYLQERQRRLLFLRERELDAERREHLERSLHDPLTGLPNRDLLHDRIAQALAHSVRDRSVHAGLFVDLDGFKGTNDRLGHEAGDRLLSHVATALTQTMRTTDTVARIGGDEFFVLTYGLRDPADAIAQAKKILACIAAVDPALTGGPRLGASIGICLFPYPGATVSDIVARADRAMYQAKRAGKNTWSHAV